MDYLGSGAWCVFFLWTVPKLRPTLLFRCLELEDLFYVLKVCFESLLLKVTFIKLNTVNKSNTMLYNIIM